MFRLGSELTPQEQLNEVVETSMQQLINLAQNTSVSIPYNLQTLSIVIPA